MLIKVNRFYFLVTNRRKKTIKLHRSLPTLNKNNVIGSDSTYMINKKKLKLRHLKFVLLLFQFYFFRPNFEKWSVEILISILRQF